MNSQLEYSIAAEDVRTSLIERTKYASDASHYLFTPQAIVVARDASEVADRSRSLDG